MPKTFERDFVKICGVTNVHDAQLVATKGASALGVIFASSPRRVTIERARAVADSVKGTILRGAVFFDDDDDFVLEHLDAVEVDFVQVHGALNDALLRALRDASLLVVKALNVDDVEFFDFDESSVDAVLIDGPRPGSGVAHSWNSLRERQFSVPVIAAGGLNASNVNDVIQRTKASGVDCASGVETSPGIKDARLVGEFIASARDAFATREA